MYVSEAKHFSSWLKISFTFHCPLALAADLANSTPPCWVQFDQGKSKTRSRHLTSATLGEKAAAKYKELTQCLLNLGVLANLRDFQTEATRQWQLVTVKDTERPRDLESPWGLETNNKPFSSACKCGSEQHLKHSDEGAWGLSPWCPLLCHRC